MASAAVQLLTEAEYLEIERAATTKSEFYNGRMFAMSGAKLEHVLITGNIAAELRASLRGRSCRVLPNDMRVKVSASGLYTYPDVSVVCGEPILEDERGDTLLNPVLIVEVLSPSTEAYDRGDKFAQYQWIESLQEYVLVSQDRCRIERYIRHEEEKDWLYTAVSEPSGSITLASIGCELALAEVYYQVDLPEGEPVLRPSVDPSAGDDGTRSG
jgi:Uma2 family endonuclease